MGVLNVTPDSFSDGGRFASVDDAVEAALGLFEQGADVVDIGGESTRPSGDLYGPGKRELPVEEELGRVLPVIEGLRKRTEAPLSVDTRKGAVARAAIAAGASVVNDVSGGLFDAELLRAAAQAKVALVLMHMRGTPETMASQARYQDVVAEVKAELQERIDGAVAAGVSRGRIWIDPGLGFAKNADQSRELLARLGELGALGQPLVVGTSRKSFLGATASPAERLPESLAAAVLAAWSGAAMVRVHDVAETARALAVTDGVRRARQTSAAGQFAGKMPP
jgi:dihydropteroate synthase